jgi:Flp pilus assembly pilin Flp
MKMRHVLSKFWGDEEGLTTVEYALLLALLVVAALATWAAFGNTVKGTIANADSSIQDAQG